MDCVEKIKRKRRRTGCLSCRARRVRCDERKPTCERCENANVECAGYESRRQVAPRPKASQTTEHILPRANHFDAHLLDTQSNIADTIQETLQGSHKVANHDCAAHNTPYTPRNSERQTLMPVPISVRNDGAPLTALLSNPDSSQRPCTDARGVLAYHQYIFRTSSILFSPEHMGFWRDGLYHEAWGCEYLHLAITALGNMHRAALLLQMPSDNDRDRGLDTKVIAFQTYTRALETLSGHIGEAEGRLDILVAALELLAYFECFAGNVLAALGHIQVAAHYHVQIDVQSNTTTKSKNGCRPIPQWNRDAMGSGLQDLCQIRRMALPLFRPTVLAQKFAPSRNVDSTTNMANDIGRESGMPLSVMLQRTLDNIVEESGMESLVWDVWTAHEQAPTASEILKFKNRLHAWQSKHIQHLPQQTKPPHHSALQSFQEELKSDEVLMPPLLHTEASTSSACLVVAALYNFYLGRIMWSLALLYTEPTESNETSAYFYFYESLRFVATQLHDIKLRGSDRRCGFLHDSAQYVPSEGLKPGLLAMLHVIAQCSPHASWLRVIVDMIRQVGHEGLISGEPLAISLIFLQAFETCSGVHLSEQRYPPPAERVIMTLIPEIDGRTYVCYYARPISSNTSQEGARQYEPIGHGRWSNSSDGEDKMKPEVEVYGTEHVNQRFTRDWLLDTQVAREWLDWSMDAEFDLCRALRNHIDGSRPMSTQQQVLQ